MVYSAPMNDKEIVSEKSSARRGKSSAVIHPFEFPVHSIEPLEETLEKDTASFEKDLEALTAFLSKDTNIVWIQELQSQLQRYSLAETQWKAQAITLKEAIVHREAKITSLSLGAKTNKGGILSTRDPQTPTLRSPSPPRSSVPLQLSVTSNSMDLPHRQIDYLNKQVSQYERKCRTLTTQCKANEQARLEALANVEVVRRLKVVQVRLLSELETVTDQYTALQSSRDTTDEERNSYPKMTSTGAQTAMVEGPTSSGVLESAYWNVQSEKEDMNATCLRLQAETSQLTSCLSTGQEKMQVLQSENNSLQKMMTTLQTTNTRLSSEIEILSSSLEMSFGTATDSESTSAKLLLQIKGCETTIALQRTVTQKGKERVDELERENQHLLTVLQTNAANQEVTASTESDEQPTMLRQWNEERTTLRKELDDLYETHRTLCRTAAVTTSQMETLSKDLAEMTNERDVHIDQEEYLTLRLQDAHRQNQELNTMVFQMTPRNEAYDTMMSSLSKNIEDKEKEMETLQNQLLAFQTNAAEIEQTSQNMRNEMIILQCKYDELLLLNEKEEKKMKRVEENSCKKRTDLFENQQKLGRTISELEALKQENVTMALRLTSLKEQGIESEALCSELSEELNKVEAQEQHARQNASSQASQVTVLTSTVSCLRLEKDTLSAQCIEMESELSSVKRRSTVVEAQLARAGVENENLHRQTTEHTVRLQQVHASLHESQESTLQYTTLCRQIERDRDNIQEQVDNLVLKQSKDEKEKKEAIQAKVDIQREMSTVQEAWKETKMWLSRLDEEKDAVQHDLDRQLERCATLTAQLSGRDSESTSLQGAVEGATSQVTSLQDQLKACEDTVVQSQRQLKATLAAQMQLKASVQCHVTTIAQVSEDLLRMTQENQALGNELSRERHAVSLLQNEYKTSTNTIARVQENLQAKEIQLRDVITTYRGMCEENEAHKMAILERSCSAQEEDASTQALTVRLLTLQETITTLLSEKEAMEGALTEYGRQVSFLSNQVLVQDTVQGQYAARQETAAASVLHATSTVHALSQERSNIANDSSAWFERAKGLEGKVTHMGLEKNTLENKVLSLQASVSDLQVQLERRTRQLAVSENQMETIRNERSSLAEELELRYTTSPAEDRAVPSRDVAVRPVEEECAALEKKLTKQKEMVKSLQDDQKRFEKYARKYESELQSRDDEIVRLRATSPDATTKS